eukprot:IDg1605t1
MKLSLVLLLSLAASLAAGSALETSSRSGYGTGGIRILSGGDPCGHGKLGKCGPKLVCAGTGNKARCVMPMPLGGRCANEPYWICKAGLLCQKGRCIKEVGPGGQCNDPFRKCKSGLTCIGGVCKTEVGPGGSCKAPNTFCSGGLTCSSSGFCVSIIGLGGKCAGKARECK